ncbi:MAG: hypothetical protein KA941_02410 [Flavobacteriales bacterium]|nr:hypothetical protein [Flavobacteriales bacterium]
MSYYKKDPIVHRPATADADCIRVRLNRTTVVLLKSMKSFASWKERYPEAEVIEPEAIVKKEEEAPAKKKNGPKKEAPKGGSED